MRWRGGAAAPVLTPKYFWPERNDIDAPLVTGAILFGIGWGLVGICPGPALVNLAGLSQPILVFVAAMALGMLAYEGYRRSDATAARPDCWRRFTGGWVIPVNSASRTHREVTHGTDQALRAPPPGINAPPLSFATRVGDLLFISGIPGFDANGELPAGFEAQFGIVVANLKRVLTEAGATMRDLVKVNVLLTRASDVAPMNTFYAWRVRASALPGAHHLRGAGAAQPAMLIEIEGVAALKS